MIQINLIPDVKKEFLKSQRLKRTFVAMSVLISLAFVALTILLFAYVQFVQPMYQNRVQGDIDNGLSELESQEDGQRIVTVQGALKSLPGLQDNKVISSRFNSYLTTITPRDVRYDEALINFEENTITLRGSATSNVQANILADQIKNTSFTYTQNEEQTTVNPFESVVFKTLSLSQQAQDGHLASFELSFTFDAVLFDQSITKQKLTSKAQPQDTTQSEGGNSNNSPFGEDNTPAGEQQ